MRKKIVKWLGALGLGHMDANSRPVDKPIPLPSSETFGEAFVRGRRLRLLEPIDLSSEFQAKLVRLCKADPNVAGVWLMWLASADAALEIVATLILDRTDELAMRDFIRRANALGGPSFVVAIPDSVPKREPFYQRSGWALPRP